MTMESTKTEAYRIRAGEGFPWVYFDHDTAGYQIVQDALRKGWEAEILSEAKRVGVGAVLVASDGC